MVVAGGALDYHPLMATHRSESIPFGVNLFGYLTSNLGLGVAARNTAHMLQGCGVPLKLVDVNPGGGMQGKDTTFAEAIAASAGVEPYRVNLFHINPDQVLYQLSPLAGTVALEGRVNACVPFWELPRLPASWLQPLSAFDAVFAPTHYIETAILSELPDARVIHYPQTVHVPSDIRADRSAFGLPDDAFVTVTSFDMRSDIERKNPWAAIQAFRDAFPQREDVRLVIKVNNVDTIAGLERHVTRLREVAADPRVIVIDRPMAYREVLGLYASGDALISLHRAEGLGLSLLEAMALGKPVVATMWSGNTDFMTAENSLPVGYDEVEVVSSTQPAYGKGTSGRQYWAEAHVEEASEALRRLADDAALRQRIGARAAEDVAALTTRYDSGVPLVPALEALTPRAGAGERMARLRRRYFVNQGRRIARAVVHRTRTRLGLR